VVEAKRVMDWMAGLLSSKAGYGSDLSVRGHLSPDPSSSKHEAHVTAKLVHIRAGREDRGRSDYGC
jgi:hypothetical protein